MSESTFFLSAEGMEDGIIRDTKVSAHEIDEKLGIRHLVIGADSGEASRDCIGQRSS